MLYVKGAQQSGVAVGALLLAQSLPHLLGPVTGTLVDRVNLKRIMVACEAGQFGIFAAIAWWQPPFVALLGMVALAAALDTTFGPASASSVAALVEGPGLMKANAWMGTSVNLQVAVGPFLGGLLVSAFGTRWALAANALSFALSAMLLGGLPSRLRARADQAAGIYSAGMEGLQYAFKQPAIRSLVVGVFMIVAFAAVDNVALVFLARDVLHTTALGFGTIAAAFGVGMLASSLVLSWLRSVPRSAPLVLAGWLLSGIGTVATGLAPNVGTAASAQVVGGAGNGIDNVAAATLIQERVPSTLLGRVFGLYATAAFAGSALAYALAGFLLDATSPRMTFVIAGIGTFAVLLLAGLPLLRSGQTATPVRP